jgi:hypothetical protein
MQLDFQGKKRVEYVPDARQTLHAHQHVGGEGGQQLTA